MTDASTPSEDSATQHSNLEMAVDAAAAVAATAAKKPKKEIPRGPRVFGKFASLIVVVPFVVYLSGMMVGDYLDKLRVTIHEKEEKVHGHDEGGHKPPQTEEEKAEFEKELAEKRATEDASRLWLPKYHTWYPTTYSISIVATTILVLAVFGGYLKAPFNFSWLSVAVGVVGIFVWIGLVEAQWAVGQFFQGLEQADAGGEKWTTWIGETLAGTREAFNPFDALKQNPSWMWQFLAIRFFGLVIIVPLVEEFFLRGFLMRYVDDPDWDEIPLGYAGTLAILSVTIYGVIAHPAEMLAAAAWFSMVTWLFLKTSSIWNCVIAHSVTNLLLGLYVVYYGAWYLW